MRENLFWKITTVVCTFLFLTMVWGPQATMADEPGGGESSSSTSSVAEQCECKKRQGAPPIGPVTINVLDSAQEKCDEVGQEEAERLDEEWSGGGVTLESCAPGADTDNDAATKTFTCSCTFISTKWEYAADGNCSAFSTSDDINFGWVCTASE